MQTQDGSFSREKPFLLDDQLADDERMIRDAAAAFAADKLAPRVQLDKIFREMGATGPLGVTIPAENGGVGTTDIRDRSQATQEDLSFQKRTRAPWGARATFTG